MKRVAVTGLGAVSPLGNTVDLTWKNLLAKKSGISQIQKFDASHFPTTIAAEVKDFKLGDELIKKNTKYSMEFTRFALKAASEAIINSGFEITNENRTEVGVVTGSGMMTAEFSYLKKFQKFCAKDGDINWQTLNHKSQDFYQLTDFGKTVSNCGLSLLIQQFNIAGFSSAVHTACASGGQALGLALNAIRRGDAKCILAGGFDSMINPLGLSSFCLLGALSTGNDNPEAASRPFDLTRNGFVLGEGAAFLFLEEFEHAKQRGAKIYAELAGEGNSISSYRITDSHPSGDGAIQAIQGALKDANIKPSMVDCINAHGTSTKMNDLSETNAIKAVFGKNAYKIPISATKSQTGHLIAAAGALEAVFCVLSINYGQIPMTANLQNPDPDCDLDYVVEGPREKSVGVMLSNSFGFGGSNSCLLFKHPDLTGK